MKKSIFILFLLLIFTIVGVLFSSNSKQSELMLNNTNLYAQVTDESIVTGSFDTVEQEILLEVAASSSKRMSGLMFRKELDANAGMLFAFENPQPLTFYMKNTYIPLDMIFLNQNYKVVTIHENTKPLQMSELYAAKQNAQYVIEMEGGWVKTNGLVIGDIFEVESID